MDYTETLTILGTQDTERRETKTNNKKHNTTQKTKKTDTTKNSCGEHRCSRSSCFLSDTRHVTHIVAWQHYAQ